MYFQYQRGDSMQEPQQPGLSGPANLGPMLPGGMPFGVPPPAQNAQNRLNAAQFPAGMGGAFPLNRSAPVNPNMGILRGNQPCATNGFAGMGGSMRSNPPGQAGMSMGNPYVPGMIGASAGLQPPQASFGQGAGATDILAMIQKGSVAGLPSGPQEMQNTETSANSQFDINMTEFPVLTNRGAMQQQQPPPPPGMHGSVTRQAAMQPPEPEFAIHSEEFPALPGATAKGRDAFSGAAGIGQGSSSRCGSHVEGMDPGGGFPAGGFGGAHMPPVDSSGLLSQQPLPGQQKSKGGGGADGVNSADPWSLLGLLSVIRMTDADLNYLALGTDLTSLGLNLNSQEPLHGTFASPWADGPVRSDPEYSLPQCYYMQPPSLKTSHFSKFRLETLFYIFYNMPRDTLQAYAATELYNREWRYHKDLKLWFTRNTSQGTGEDRKGQYVFFDINVWEKKMFQGSHQGSSGACSASEQEADLGVNMDEGGSLLAHA